MNKFARRLLSSVLAGALMLGMCLTASATYGNFKYPSSYWPVHEQWEAAVAAKDLDAIIDVAQKTYDVLDPLGLGQDVCENLEPKSQIASWACEIKGDLDGAIKWTERQRTYAKWLNECGLTNEYGNSYNYNDMLQSLESRLDYLRAAQTVTVYAQAGGSAGTWYGTPVDGSRSDTNAALIYLTFNGEYSMEYWVDYYNNTSESFRKANNGGVIELAWNFNPESTAGSQAVLNADSYIAETLKTLGGLNATVLLRVGAEMNNWSDSNPEVFKQAFRKVASAARAYSNIQMVFSPNDISNRNVTYADYYPGDEYVDWVGMSTYHNSQYVSYDQSRGTASYSFDYDKYYDDAFYGVGIYDHDPLITIKPIIELAREHNKPVMVSECGFAYRSDTGADLTSYAAAQLNWFYSYINMVYPEVKAVFYFDTSSADTAYSYKFSGSATLSSAYEKAIRDNGAYLADVKGSVTGWTALDKAALDGQGIVRLAAYATLPGQHSTTVKYILDGAEVYSTSQAPFYYDLNMDSLSAGNHTLKVEVSGGQFNVASQSYSFNKGGSQPSVEQPPVEQPSSGISVTVNGNAVEWTDARPFIDANSRTMVPLRAVADAMGLDVNWDAPAREASFTDGSKTIYFPIDSNSARTSDGGAVQMDTAAVIANDRTYAPIRYLAEYFGYEVGWDAATQTVSLKK